MGRKLRVDFSNEGTDDNDGGDPRIRDNGPPTNGNNGHLSQQQPASLPPLPPGKELPAGVTATDAISRTLNTLPPAQLLDVLAQMKQLASTDAARATELLTQAPQLSYAIFQALLLMGLVSPEAINSVVDTSAGPPPQQQHQAAPPPVQAPPVPIPGYPGFHPAPFTHTPPVPGGYAPPPQQVPAPAPVAPDQASLLAQVMALPQETIDRLPEAERNQVLVLRAQFAAQQR